MHPACSNGLLNSIPRINLCLDSKLHDLIITKITTIMKHSWLTFSSEQHVWLVFYGLEKWGSENLSHLPMVTQHIWAEPAFNPAFSDPRSFLHSSGHDFKGFYSVNEEAALQAISSSLIHGKRAQSQQGGGGGLPQCSGEFTEAWSNSKYSYETINN